MNSRLFCESFTRLLMCCSMKSLARRCATSIAVRASLCRKPIRKVLIERSRRLCGRSVSSSEKTGATRIRSRIMPMISSRRYDLLSSL